PPRARRADGRARPQSAHRDSPAHRRVRPRAHGDPFDARAAGSPTHLLSRRHHQSRAHRGRRSCRRAAERRRGQRARDRRAARISRRRSACGTAGRAIHRGAGHRRRHVQVPPRSRAGARHSRGCVRSGEIARLDAPRAASRSRDPGGLVPASHKRGGQTMTRASRGAWHRIWTIARRELGAMFDHPTGYVLLVVFLAINAFLYFREIDMQGVATLRPMLALLPWVFLFFVPAVTMRTLAEDARSGVMEVVLSQPLTELEFVLGKYIGAVLFLWIALALTLCIPIGLTLGADVQWGPVAAQYVGAALLAAGLAAVGVWASSLVRSQITAFIAAVAVMFVLILVGLDQLLVGLPPALAAGAARLGVLSHFENIGRGVIDARDAVYFLSLIGVFLALAYGAVLRRKLARRGAAARRLRLGVSLLVATL